MHGKDRINWFAMFFGLVVLLSIASPIGNINDTYMDSTTIDVERGGSASVAYSPHDTIYIDSNSDFQVVASAGNGSSGNPWVIENLEIDSNNAATPCIYIRDTTDYFVIRNCNLTGASVSPGAGVSLYYVVNGEISNNTITNNEYGIFLDNTVYIGINNNTCNNNIYGIYLDESSNNTITNNNVNSNSNTGITIDYSPYCSLTNNTCSDNNNIGILVDFNSHYTTLDNNTCSGSTFGILTSAAYNCTVVNNICNNNDEIGIELGGVNFIVTRNTCNYNGMHGFRILGSSPATYTYNNASNNVNTGMWFQGGRGNTIANNTCNNNGGSGMYYNIHYDNILINNTCNDNDLYGIHFGDTDNITLTHNTCSNNNYDSSSRGILIDTISNNHTIMWNIFVNNSVDGEDQQRADLDDNAYDYNFWSDYAGEDANQDGIGDTPHTISGSAGHTDSHPLTFLPAPATWNETPTNQNITEFDMLYYDLNVTSHAPVTWSVSDTVHFTINENGTLESLGILAIGEYGLTVYVTNVYNFTTQSEFIIFVWDLTVPTWDPYPEYQYIEYGESFYYDANATDASGLDTWYLIFDWYGNFSIDVDGVITNTTPLVLTAYVVRIAVNDTYGNTIDIFIVIYNEDTVLPSWNPTPENQVAEYGEFLWYDVNATDLAGINTWWLNNTDFSIDAEGVISNDTILSVNIYALEIFVEDNHGNVRSEVITVTVEDTTLPSWATVPENQVITFGETFSYDLDATDLAGISTWWVNSTDFSIDENGLITNAIPLAVGVYRLEISCNDTHGNVLSADITVTVEAPTTTTTTTTPTSTTETTTPTSPTTTTDTPGGFDPMVLIVLGAGGAFAVLIIIIVFLKKKS